MTPIIDPEFSSLIPSLSPEERNQLEENIEAEGCRDALVVWAGENILLDGHNRFEICNRLGLPFKTAEIALSDRDAAADWIDRNQLGRRNLTPEEITILLGRRFSRGKKAEGRPKKLAQNDPVVLGPTADRLAREHGVSPATVKRAGQLFDATQALAPIVPDIEAKFRAGDVTRQAVIEAAKEPERAEEILKPHVAHNSGENNWFTPTPIIAAARDVMGGIDVDPASHSKANEAVRAASYFTAETDGLKQAWPGRVWLNPPYAQPLIDKFLTALVAKIESGETTEACVLVNNASETGWMQKMLALDPAICFHRGRIKFLDPDGKPGAPLQGQWTLYFGKNKKAFEREFIKFGPIAPSVVT